MWGGRNLTTESVQPTGFRNYARIFLGMSGGSDALQTDQNNALGNHLGAYELRASYRFDGFTLFNHWQFLWEDSSGLTPWNWRDGMVGVGIELHNNRFIDKVVLEVVRTNHQDADKRTDDGIAFLEPDNLFNNSVYRDGWTFNDRVIGNPIFLLNEERDGSISRISNMINAFQVGVAGSFDKINYRLSYIQFKNQGTRFVQYEKPKTLESIDLSLNYSLTKSSNAFLRMNYQSGILVSNNSIGMQLGYKWLISF